MAQTTASSPSLKSKGKPVYIVDGARTPFLKAQKGPGPFTPVDLAVQAGRPLLLRQSFDPREFDEVILGCVNVHPDEVNPGRVAALRLGCGSEVPGWTVQRNCASGMQSIDTAYRYIAMGDADLILAGGTEAPAGVWGTVPCGGAIGIKPCLTMSKGSTALSPWNQGLKNI